MIRRPPRSTRTDTLFPYTTLFRSGATQPHLQEHRRVGFTAVISEDRSYGPQQGLSHDFSPSLPYRLGAAISVQGAAWRGPLAGARAHQAGLRRVGGDHRQWFAAARPRPLVRRNSGSKARRGGTEGVS